MADELIKLVRVVNIRAPRITKLDTEHLQFLCVPTKAGVPMFHIGVAVYNIELQLIDMFWLDELSLAWPYELEEEEEEDYDEVEDALKNFFDENDYGCLQYELLYEFEDQILVELEKRNILVVK